MPDTDNVTLFDSDDQHLNFMVATKESNISTKDLYFTPSEVTDSTLTLTAEASQGKSLVLTYKLGKDYMLHMSLRVNGMKGLFAPNYDKIDIDWYDKCRQQEKGFTFENRYTTLTYKENNFNADLKFSKHTRLCFQVAKAPGFPGSFCVPRLVEC